MTCLSLVFNSSSHWPLLARWPLSGGRFLPAFLVELYGAYQVSARLSGRAKGTRGSVSVTVNRHEELSDRSAPYADFGHGSLFEAAPGARQFGGTAESPTQFLCMPIEIRKQHGGLHAYFNRREATPSGAASGHAKPPSSGQAPSWRDFGVR